MGDTRKKDEIWRVKHENDINTSFDGAQLAVLMDLRDELKKLNGIIGCPNFIRIPFVLDAIKKNTTKKRRKRNVKRK